MVQSSAQVFIGETAMSKDRSGIMGRLSAAQVIIGETAMSKTDAE